MSQDDRDQLEQERAKLAAIFNRADAGFVVIDGSGRVLWTNDLFAERFRSDDDAGGGVLGQSCHEVICRKRRRCPDCPAARSVADGRQSHHELKLWLRDRYHSIYLTAIPLGGVAGSEQSLLMVQDVSGLDVLRRSEDAFRASEARFRSLFDGIPVPMATLKIDGSVLQVNQPFCTMLGQTGAELMGGEFADLLHPDDRGEFFRHLRDLMAGNCRTFDVQARLTRADGTAVWGSLSGVLQLDEDSRPAYATLLIQDVTVRKQAQQELDRSRQRYETLVNSIDGIVWEADPRAQRFSFVSPRAEKLLGFPVEQWLAQPRFWRNHIHPEDLDRVVAAYGCAVVERRDFALEYRMVAADGHVVWLRDTVTLSAEDERVTLRGVMVDITEQRQAAETTRLHREQRLHAERLESLGRLAGGVAHDFGNLVTQIIGWNDFLLRGLGVSHPLRREAQKIGNAAHRAGELTRHLLAFGSQQELEPEILDVNGVVLGMDLMLRRVIREDVRLLTRLDAERGTVRADPGQIQQVILNLAVNARDAMPDGGQLAVETSCVDLDGAPSKRHAGVPPGRWVLITVADTGVGMDAHTQAHLFEPFFSTKQEGAGLGLSTVYGIVRQSGGQIRVDSKAGHGTSVRVYLPHVDAAPACAAAEIAAQPELPRGTETILLVEDDGPVRLLAREILESSGYSVIEARDGQQALELCDGDADRIDLMATDVVMPKMGGRDLARHLHEVKPELKVLYFSSYKDDEILSKGLMEADASFLQKPFTPMSLTEKVRRILDE